MNTAVDGVAIRWIGRDRSDLDDPVELAPSMTATRSNRFASALQRHGVAPGTVVATLLGRIPDQYVAALGAWKAGCVFAALDPLERPELIADQLRSANVRIVITTPTLFRRVVSPVLDRLADLGLVLVCGASEDGTAQSTSQLGGGPTTMSCGAFLSRGLDEVVGEPPDLDSPALLHFTRGATGDVHTTLHTRRQAAAHDHVIRHLLDAHDGDTYWCTADPGWSTGPTDGVSATLTTGVTSIVDEADFDAARWLHILRHQHVELLYTSATALGMLRRAAETGVDAPSLFDLRVVATAGGRLDRATESWAQDFFRVPVLDTSRLIGDGASVDHDRRIAGRSERSVGVGPSAHRDEHERIDP